VEVEVEVEVEVVDVAVSPDEHACATPQTEPTARIARIQERALEGEYFGMVGSREVGADRAGKEGERT